jgi:hypothetical protein
MIATLNLPQRYNELPQPSFCFVTAGDIDPVCFAEVASDPTFWSIESELAWPAEKEDSFSGKAAPEEQHRLAILSPSYASQSHFN